MTSHKSKDDKAMGAVRHKLPPELLQFRWSEDIELDDWDAVQAIVRPNPASGKSPVHLEYVPGKPREYWERQVDDWASGYSGTIGDGASTYA